jgi:hypothetical protein
MPTRLDLRATLRRRLEDTSGTPLWDDATLNDLLADAVRQYGIRFPKEATLAVAVPGGATHIPIIPLLAAAEVLRVRDPNGALVPRVSWTPEDAPWVSAQGWRWWSGALELLRPATAGDWQIDYLARREPPADDVTELDLRAGDEEIVVLLAASGALLRRAVEHGKRGAEPAGLALARVAESHAREVDRLITARRRQAASGWLA